jgi:hypothetical protein
VPTFKKKKFLRVQWVNGSTRRAAKQVADSRINRYWPWAWNILVNDDEVIIIAADEDVDHDRRVIEVRTGQFEAAQMWELVDCCPTADS